MNNLFNFIKDIRNLYKLYKDYGYDAKTYQHIVENYIEVLCNRTKIMSKPTYYAKDVITQIDEWYVDQDRQMEDDLDRNKPEEVLEPYCFETDREEEWYKAGLLEGYNDAVYIVYKYH